MRNASHLLKLSELKEDEGEFHWGWRVGRLKCKEPTKNKGKAMFMREFELRCENAADIAENEHNKEV